MIARIFGDESTDLKLIDYLEIQLAIKLHVIDKILARQEYMAGEVSLSRYVSFQALIIFIIQEFSLVDIFYMPYMSKLVEMDRETIFHNRPHIEAWWDKISSRPSYIRIFGNNKM